MLKTPTVGELRSGLIRPDRPPSLPPLRGVHPTNGSAQRASILAWRLGRQPRAASFLLPRWEVNGIRSEASASRSPVRNDENRGAAAGIAVALGASPRSEIAQDSSRSPGGGPA